MFNLLLVFVGNLSDVQHVSLPYVCFEHKHKVFMDHVAQHLGEGLECSISLFYCLTVDKFQIRPIESPLQCPLLPSLLSWSSEPQTGPMLDSMFQPVPQVQFASLSVVPGCPD
jgi:hypothetical protein